MSLLPRIVALVMLGFLASCETAPAEERQACVPTKADALGPFYVSDSPVVDDLNRHGKPGDPVTLIGRILSSAGGNPIAAATIEIWQTDGAGAYHPAGSGAYADYDDEAIDLRGTVISDGEGGYRVKTLLPGAYVPRPRHFHYRITAAGHRPLVTQLYISGDDAAGRSFDDCRHARLETTVDGLLYAAPDIFLTAR